MKQPSQQPGGLPPSYGDYDDDIDLLELLYTLWEAKWKIIGGGLAAAILVAAYSLFLPNVYQASALLTPAQENASGSSSQLSGLAGLAGINLPGRGSVDSTQVAIETLQSRKFLIDFIAREGIAPELAATTGYDLKKGRWLYDESRYNAQTREWLKGEAPNGWTLYSSLLGKLSVDYEQRKGLISVSLTSYSSATASDWLTSLIEGLNRHLMEKEVVEAERSIAYLQQKLQETALTEMRQVFYQLIEQQTRTIMLARSKPEYALATIDPALEPRDKFGPKRSLMVVAGGMAGAVFMVVVIFFRQWLLSRPSTAARDVEINKALGSTKR
ncbi:MAG: LPS O-antigen subunit length determinant protein (WzzB/FepE family) [Paracoccaceae bacterium]|jgi:LPS O-antigen subunit length determinant protein (WzzB/FepE family)